MAKKTNMKSVRLSDEVLEYVESFEGDGFNQKFENLVYFCIKEEKQKRILLEDLDQLITLKRKKLNAIDAFSRDLFLTQRNLEAVRSGLEDLRQSLNQINEPEP